MQTVQTPQVQQAVSMSSPVTETCIKKKKNGKLFPNRIVSLVRQLVVRCDPLPFTSTIISLLMLYNRKATD